MNLNSMEAKKKIAEWRRKLPTKRHLTKTFDQFVQKKSVEMLYTPREQKRIAEMSEMITKATCEFENDEDWDRILRVVDAISNLSNRAVLRESIRSLRIRLEDPSSRVVILALILTESIVKNCGHFALLEIGTESFLHQLELLHKIHHDKRGRESMEITERVLDLIQSWGEAFLPYRNEYPVFTEVYHNMRKKGIHFPKQYDETRVPVLTPPVHGAEQTTEEERRRNAFGHLSKREIYRTAVNVAEMLEDMVHEVTKDDIKILRKNSNEQGIMMELALQARDLVTRMENIVQRAVAEDDHEHLENYLNVNDQLNIALAKYDSLRALQSTLEDEDETNNQEEEEEEEEEDDDDQKSNQQSGAAGNDDDDDDDFAAFVRERANSRSNEKEETQDNNAEDQEEKEEEDPFAEFVQQRATKVLGPQKPNQKTNLFFDDDFFEEKIPHVVLEAATTKPKSPQTKEVDLLDFGLDEQEPQQKEAAAPRQTKTSIVQKDLWIDDDNDDDDDNFVIASSSNATSTSSTPTRGHSNNNGSKASSLIDDMWNIEAPITTTKVVTQPPVSRGSISSSNPFDDLLNSFEKTQINTSNPFDTTPRAAAPIAASTGATAAPVIKSTNPFDF